MGISCLEAKKKTQSNLSLSPDPAKGSSVRKKILKLWDIQKRLISWRAVQRHQHKNGISSFCFYYQTTSCPRCMDQPTPTTKLYGHACDTEVFWCWEEVEIAVWCICLCLIFQILIGIYRGKLLKRKKTQSKIPYNLVSCISNMSISSCCAVFEWAHGVLPKSFCLFDWGQQELDECFMVENVSKKPSPF